QPTVIGGPAGRTRARAPCPATRSGALPGFASPAGPLPARLAARPHPLEGLGPGEHERGELLGVQVAGFAPPLRRVDRQRDEELRRDLEDGVGPDQLELLQPDGLLTADRARSVRHVAPSTAAAGSRRCRWISCGNEPRSDMWASTRCGRCAMSIQA